jgi:arylsulfatase A-like enzyme
MTNAARRSAPGFLAPPARVVLIGLDRIRLGLIMTRKPTGQAVADDASKIGDGRAPSRRAILLGGTTLAAATALGTAAQAQIATQSSQPAGAALPLQTPPFQGMIDNTYKTSKSDFPQPVAPPEGAPNVLIVLIDDLGFAGTSPYGGLIPTSNIDAAAGRGLIYNEVHNTALCSPTRAALLSGRNHHQLGMGGITEGATGFPGYDSVWGQENGSIAEVLRYHGYSTAAFGKWHNTPDWETSAAGPFFRWPTGKGFDYFYGFQGGETSQYNPQLFQNTRAVEPAKTPEQGYTLNEDLADHAVDWLREQQSIAPDKPWFAYYAPGAMHAPHHVPKPYIERFRGKFDMGWDKYRELVFANQRKLGVVPQNAKLSERPEELPSWDSLSADQKRLFARQMEVFAGFMVQTDEQVGRVLEAVRQSPHGDNTLIFLILGDNGCSAEGGLNGTLNNMATQNGFPDDVATMLKSIDEIGGPKHENHFSVGWAWALDTPFQWTKQIASHFGGTRSGFLISWPARIKAKRELRSQWHHVIDVAPTIYEAVGIEMPDSVNGIKQVPLAGVSMAYTFDDAKAPSRRTTQYFEIMGNRAIYQNGWIAAARHGVPWVLIGKKGDFENDKWELYDLANDFSEARDVASLNPDKLKELQALFEAEAKKYNVYPLDDRFAERGVVADRPSVTRGRTEFVYLPGTVRVPEGTAPNVKARSHRITAEFEIPKGEASGVIVAAGGSGGYSLFVKDGRLMYENNFFGKERDLIKSKQKLPTGKVTAVFDYMHEATTYGGGGTGRLFVNGAPVGEAKFAHVPPARYSATETFDVGMDLGEAVSNQYKSPYRFTGNLKQVKIELLPMERHTETEERAREAYMRILASLE